MALAGYLLVLGRKGEGQMASNYRIQASHVVQWQRIHLPIQQTWVRSLGLEDPLKEGMATHSSILAGKIPRTEEPGGLQSIGLQRVRHNSLDELSPAYEEHRQRTWKTQHRLKQILFPFPKLPIHPGTLTYSQVREEAGRRTGVDEGGKCRGILHTAQIIFPVSATR